MRTITVFGMFLCVLVGVLASECGAGEEIAHFRLDGPVEIPYEIEGVDVAFAPDVSTDGNGSLRITYDNYEPCSIVLFEIETRDIGNCVLTYSASLRCENLVSPAYAEMYAVLGGNAYFSRGLNFSVQDTQPWRSVETPFFLEKGQNPEKIQLGVRMEGPGVVWVDDMRLEKGRGSSMAMARWAWLPGTLVGVLAGLWGTLLGVLAPKAIGRRWLMGYGFALLGLGVVFLVLGIVLAVSGWSWDASYGLLLPGIIANFPFLDDRLNIAVSIA